MALIIDVCLSLKLILYITFFILFHPQVGNAEYDLVLSADLNSVGHTQWFCFRVRKMQHGQRYRMHIINFEKSSSAFNMGMRPVLYSAKQVCFFFCAELTAALHEHQNNFLGTQKFGMTISERVDPHSFGSFTVRRKP